MTVMGLMRVKDEARWIADSVRSLKALCHPVLVLDDHSTDGTPEICEAEGAIVYRSGFTGLDESRDKNLLCQKAEALTPRPDWCFMLDGDEILDPSGVPIIRAAMESGTYDSYMVRFIYLWDRLDQMRVDGVYARAWRQSAWKMTPGARFMQSGCGGNFHCGSVPQKFMARARKCEARIFHLGYLNREDRLRKYEWYNAPDKQPLPPNEDGYRHFVIGDLPDLPASTVTKHAGPLELRPI